MTFVEKTDGHGDHYISLMMQDWEKQCVFAHMLNLYLKKGAWANRGQEAM